MPNNLSYPLDVEGDPQQGHYIMFMINQTTPGTVGTRASKKTVAMDEMDDAGLAAGIGFQGKKFINDHLNKGAGKDTETFRRAPPKGGLHLNRPGTIRMSQAITLYMPPSVKVSYKSNYKNDEISGRASGIGNVIESVVSAMSAPKGNWASGAGKLAVANSVVESAVEVAALAGKAMAETAAPGAVTLAQLSAGSILGSKMEVMFTDVGRRNFSFAFNFIPKSEKESRMVYDIVQTFKEHMLPEYQTSIKLHGRAGMGGRQRMTVAGGRVLSIPDTFDIFYFYYNNENPFLNRISTCYLNSMDIDYGGDKYVTYEPTTLKKGQEGPPPQRTAISLSFTEIETITRERAKQGF